MTNPNDSPNQSPTHKTPKPRVAGEGPSGSTPPPRAAGASPSPQPLRDFRPHTTAAVGGGETAAGESSTGGWGGETVAVSEGLALLAIGGCGDCVEAASGEGGSGTVHRKRTRDGGVPPPVEGQQFQCPVCGRFFPSNHSLSGHMKSHPHRGWRGIHPPPVFSRDEFGDILGQAEEEVAMAASVKEGETVGDKEEEEEVVVAVEEGREEVAAEKGGDGTDLNEEPPRKLLDLNRTPSPEE
ncbi:hypothetical protein Acr_21g0000470 [Actinidia rufa]|uniref:C2H2-type domain-containing protein n=1 Tax=Actinidia rufa TaxID=165716 RepID=A0A7J0GFF2_9ERIC|nr:hypothetical protein Acr_21g0000470 [Actinidia rufa]